MNSFKMAWIQLNSTRFIDLKMKSDFDKVKILRLYNDFPLMINHRKDLRYCIIDMKVDKVYRAIDDTMKKNCFLNKIWLKLRRSNSKFNFILTILKTHKDKTILFILHFSEMFMCVKWINCYFIVFLMLIISRSEISFRKLFFIWYFYII